MSAQSTPKIAILRWEQTRVPRGLQQLESLKGNSTNPESYPFPVRLVEVPGACTETVITHPSDRVLKEMISLCAGLKADGVKAVTTSCGFNAIFQETLAKEAGLPVFSSALLEIPFIRSLIGETKDILILTANRASLREEHFRACHVTDLSHLKIYGLETAPQWSKIFQEPDECLDLPLVREEIVSLASRAVNESDKPGAILLECTDLPPFAESIRTATGLPVFDFLSMMGHVALSIGELSL